MKIKKWFSLNDGGEAHMIIGEGLSSREILLQVYSDYFDNPSEFLEEQYRHPFNLSASLGFSRIKGEEVFAFRKQLFIVKYESGSESSEEAILRIKKMVLVEEQKRKKLKREVEALEGLAVAEKMKRSAIPDIVKLIVYERDEGKCVRCGSNISIQFDHIIPVAKGGSNTAENIQILCQRCNLEKSDKIMF